MRLSPLSAAVAGLLSLTPSLAQGAAEILAHTREERGPRLVVDGGRHRIESGQEIRPVELPPGATVDALERLGGGWLVAGSAPDGAGDNLLLVRGDEQLEERLPPPPGRVGKKRETAVPFVDRGELVGVAWLEGAEARTFDVRFAAWRGGSFDAPVVVAPTGPGSQLALAGCRLANGRLLLVWAGYDGEDDEIWYSLGSGSGWSKPRRVAEDNAVPDITPAVAPLSGGAIVTWSRYDGSEYRLVTARFEGDEMRGARWAAPPGSLYPSIEAGPSGLAILYRDARSSAWTIAEMSADGAPGRRAQVESEGDERPLVSFEGGTVLWSFGDHRAVSGWQ